MNPIISARIKMKEIEEASYDGNIGLMEVAQFYMKAKEKGDHSLIARVDRLIKENKIKKAWTIILDYVGVKLKGAY
jgi:hypothetical protein